MPILYNLEGPKGSGKSTLANALVSKYNNLEIRKFDSNNIVSNYEFEYAIDKDVIFDRGILSYQIYDWLWNNGISKLESNDFSTFNFFIKTPINKKHFDILFSKLKYKMVIFYSSDFDILKSRIENRNKETGKGANELEWSTLKDSNLYFKYMGLFLKELYPDKVELIDVAENKTVDEIIDFISNEDGD